MNMSFSKTKEQVRNRTKTVTRRLGWWFLKPGDRLCAIEKGQGLKKGEHVVRICQIEIISVRKEQVGDIYCQPDDLRKEGFPDLTIPDFIAKLCGNRKIENLMKDVNRIEFKYI